MKPVLKAKSLYKRFPGVVAVNDVDFEVYEGEILSLIGENGAGKSTLIKILTGVLQPDSGEIEVEGERVQFKTPLDAFSKGISVIHQELSLAGNLTVAENVFLANEITRGNRNLLKRVLMNEMNERTRELLSTIKARFEPDILVEKLTTAEKQLVEICKALSKNPKVIFMDEPTSALTIEEVEALFEVIRDLKRRGISIVFVSHRIEEVLEISDRIIVMRDGKRVATMTRDQATVNGIIKAMVGREIEFFPRVDTNPSDVILKVENLKWRNKVKSVSFELRRGEVLGFAGLVGAGRTETMLLIFGIEHPEEGEIYLKGEKVAIRSPQDAIRYRIGLIPEDRKLQGLILAMTVKDNIVIPSLKRISRFGWILDERSEEKLAEEYVNLLKIKTPSVYQIAENLSGGNQQKVVLAKWLSTNSDILIFDEPTRGIDVATKAEIHRMIRELAAQGKGVIMISSELPEILNLSDRVVVMWEGRVMAVLDNSKRQLTQEEIMYYASGQSEKVRT